MPDLDLTKPVQTRDGRKVRILCTDADNPKYPIIGLMADDSGHEQPHAWTASGYWGVVHPRKFDLVNVPPPSKWYNVYADCVGGKYASRGDAEAHPAPSRIALLELTASGEAILHTDVRK